MKCPFCLHSDTAVVDSRESEDLSSIRRRRECEKCGKRFTTYERVETTPLIVVKKDGRRESYDRNKLLGGILKACEKRPISLDLAEGIVNDIERKLCVMADSEIASREIGQLVMERLKKLDKIAYVRFASVYRQFQDVEDFEKVARLLK
ncbi:MAG: transcriptional regulator NrdR [Candidatus Woykebacteria bacterium RBG_13_40_7b]|uniref:Transcriptional repressor NrdR n=1 Tax=Candidatus Woykebacteria bacterium RBG_13_40_7b TaxID=1802594 RepID=A0A1G1W600_9BACT|nr:MAG: transcriptional regulator NrdR [Candidatus Woykebacteria bacterium RBG_13_40_7b]